MACDFLLLSVLSFNLKKCCPNVSAGFIAHDLLCFFRTLAAASDNPLTYGKMASLPGVMSSVGFLSFLGFLGLFFFSLICFSTCLNDHGTYWTAHGTTVGLLIQLAFICEHCGFYD